MAVISGTADNIVNQSEINNSIQNELRKTDGSATVTGSGKEKTIIYKENTYVLDIETGIINKKNPRKYNDEVKNSLTEGKYVIYDEEPYRVLYDVNSEYNWIEIVSVNPLDAVTLGYNDLTIPTEEEGYDFTGSNSQFEKTRWSFNNSIKTLNLKAQEYLTNLADRTRCLGSNPINPDLDTDLMFSNNRYGYFQEWNNKFKDKVTYSTIDETQLNKINAKKTINYGGLGGYFLASHSVYIDSNSASFGIGYAYSSGYISSVMLCAVNSLAYTTEQYYSSSLTKGFRPVIRLKDSVKITGGSGLLDSPYTISL